MAALASRRALDSNLGAVTGAVRRENEARRRIAREALEGANSPCTGGHHLWLRLPARVILQVPRSGLVQCSFRDA